MDTTVDVAIIGSGTSGLNAMAQVRRAGKSFVLINDGELGTTCARVGCMPSKVMIQVAEDFARRRSLSRYGIHGGDGLHLDHAEAMEHVQDMRDIFVDRTLAGSTDEMGQELIRGFAQFIDPNTLSVDGRIVSAQRIVIATGSTPIVPTSWQDLGERLLTSDDIFELEQLPESMAVIGLGVIGLELGQALQRMGIEVTGVDQLEQIGGLSDPVANRVAIDTIGKEFPLWLGASADLQEDGGRLRVSAGERSVLVDKVLVSIGRRPQLERLGLDKLGVQLGPDGLPEYNPNTMQVANLPIFIAGDVNGMRAILHEASDEGKIAGYNAGHETIKAFRRKTPLSISFTDPNLVMVGRHWEGVQDHPTLALAEMPMGPVGRALITAKNKGVIRLYGERSSGELLGATMVASKAEHLGHLLAWAIEQRLTVHDLLRMPFYHPTIEEGLQAALYRLLKETDSAPTPILELRELESV